MSPSASASAGEIGEQIGRETLVGSGDFGADFSNASGGREGNGLPKSGERGFDIGDSAVVGLPTAAKRSAALSRPGNRQ